MTTSGRSVGILACVASVLAGLGVARLWAQGRGESSDPLGSLAALTAEVHQLRLAIEDSTHAQTQTQALAVYLSVQKDRVGQVATRLDSLRRDLDATAAQSRQHAEEVTRLEAALPSLASDGMRLAASQQLDDLKRALARSTAQEQVLRSRESELSQSLQTEEAQWRDLAARLEQIIRR